MPNVRPDEAIKTLLKKKLLVGIPAANNQRQGEAVGNVLLGYVHEFGSPARNIPARPFLVPGINAAMDQVKGYMEQAALKAFIGEPFDQELGSAGQAAVNSVQGRIRAGIPPPLLPATVRARQRRSTGSTYRRAAKSPGDTTPLIDTASLLESITWVIRDG